MWVQGQAMNEEVDFRFVCFVKSNKNSRIYELDGDRKCPTDKGIVLVVIIC